MPPWSTSSSSSRPAHFSSSPRSATPILRALPPVFVVRLPPGPGAEWVRASIDYAVAEAAVPSDRSASLVSTRLPELVLIEVLREHLATAPAADHGWLPALRDPVVSPALTLIHGQPDRSWTVADFAACTAASRSLLDQEFRAV